MDVIVYLPSTSFSPTPIVVSYTPDTTTKDVVQDLSKKFQVQGEQRVLVITPTSVSTGGVVDPRACIKSVHLEVEERLELWKSPLLVNILLVDYTSQDPIKLQKEIIFDYGSPLSYNIPLLRRIFNLESEFVFQYVHSLEDEKNSVWLDSKKSLADQSFEGTYWLMCTPVKLLKGKDGLSRCTETIKEGFLVKQTKKGNKQTAKQKRWAVLKDQFLFYFRNKGDASPAGVIPLEYYTLSMVQIKQQPTLHLKRAIDRFDECNAELYIMYAADDNDDLNKWKEVLQRKCLGTGSVFGVTLHEMDFRPSKKPHIPDVVINLTDYLTTKALDDEGILRVSGSNTMVQFYKDQFDREINVDLSGVQDVHVVASLLKMYFRELPDPAIPFNFYDEIMDIMNLQGPQKAIDVAPLVLETMSKLPDAHFYVVKHMCRFLFEVQKHSAKNKMSLAALGTVMGPNLLRPPDNRIGAFVQDSLPISEFIQILIQNHDLISKGSTALKTLPRPAPLRSDDSTKSLNRVLPVIEEAPDRPKRPTKLTKARASVLELTGVLLMEPIPKQRPVANPPKLPPILSFAPTSPNNITDTPPYQKQPLSRSPPKHLLSFPLSGHKKNSPPPSTAPSPRPPLPPTPGDIAAELKKETASEGKVQTPRIGPRKGEHAELVAKEVQGNTINGEIAKPKGSAIAWNKAAASARPRLSTMTVQSPLNAAFRQATNPADLTESISNVSVFDMDTVLLFLVKLDETEYKKGKISLDSIKGGITGEYAKEKEQLRQLFCAQMASMLEVLDHQKSKAPAASWASLFYQRGQKCEDVLSHYRLLHYQHLLNNYLRILRKKEAKEGQNPTCTARIKVAEVFLDFLSSHTTDPDSCLIGLQCSEDAVRSVMRHVDPASTDPTNSTNVSYQQLCSMVVEWGMGEDDAWMKEQIQKLCTAFRGVDKMEKGDVAIVAQGSEDGTKTMIFARFTGMKKNNNTYLEFFISPEESKTEWIFRRDVYPLTANIKESIKTKANLSKVVHDPAHNFFKILKDNMKMQTDEFLVKNGVDPSIMKKVREGIVELKDLPAVRDALTIVNKFHENPPEHFYKEMAFYAKALVSIHTRKLANIPAFTFFLSRAGTNAAMRNFASSPLAPSLIRTSLGQFQSAYDGLAVNVKELMFGSKKRKMSDWWLDRIEQSVQHFLVKRRFDFNAVPENYSIEPPQSMKAVKDNLAILEEILHAEPGTTMSPTPLVETVCAEIYPTIDAFIKDARIVICDALKLDINFEDSTFNMELVDESFKKSKEQLPQQTSDQLKNLIGDLKYLEEMKRLEKTKDGEKMAHIIPIGGLVMNQLVRTWNEQKTVIDIWGHLDRLPTPEPPAPTLKVSRSMDSLYMDPNTGAVESTSKASHTPPETSPLASSTSSLAASIAASFIMKATNPHTGEIAVSHAHGLSPAIPARNKRYSPPSAKSYLDGSHGRSGETPEEAPRPPPKGRSLMRNNSSIGMTTLRGVRRFLEKDDKDQKEKEKEKEKGRERSLQLHKMVNEQRIEDIQQLLADPTISREINAQDADGWTPLHCSCHLGHFDLCMLLLHQDKIDVTTKNKDGNTALHYAVRHPGGLDIVMRLLKNGANPNAPNSRSETPLHYACMRGHVDIISFLLAHGADANALNSDGDNSLHYAIYTRSLEVIRLLLRHGANPEVCSRRQGTPIDIAVKNNFVDIAEELKKAPKKPSRGEA
eukprot:Phypoly_transcript_00278.p1 GENE.Phypoly_transcript_00278~~Phypoly_transcript_00278.p1  ORF type:complete len:1707 (+),score=276.94 Phypoly_transcript_00278:341-5461(+)